MASGNIGSGEDEDEVSHHRHCYWLLRDIPKFEGKDEQPCLHLMEFEDYLVASLTSSRHHLKTMQESGLECTLR